MGREATARESERPGGPALQSGYLSATVRLYPFAVRSMTFPTVTELKSGPIHITSSPTLPFSGLPHLALHALTSASLRACVSAENQISPNLSLPSRYVNR